MEQKNGTGPTPPSGSGPAAPEENENERPKAFLPEMTARGLVRWLYPVINRLPASTPDGILTAATSDVYRYLRTLSLDCYDSFAVSI